MSRQKGPVALVTGGAGFLGRFLVKLLQEQTVEDGLVPSEIRVFDLEPGEFDNLDRVVCIAGDVRSPTALRQAFEDVDIVFHTAAVIDWGNKPEALIHDINVDGTFNVIAACRKAGVPILVHTSSEDAVYDGKPVCDGDESLPYTTSFPNAYCRSKALSEQAVLRANGRALEGDKGVLKTVVIRPCGLYGEGDPYHVGSVVELAKKGVLFRMGDGTGRCQQVYVGNVAHGHLLAAKALLDGNRAVAGQVYFITDSEGANFFDFLEPIVSSVGLRMHPWHLALPRSLMYGVGCAMEAIARAAKPIVRLTPLVNRFSVNYVCHQVTFTSEKARNDLGYHPIYSQQEAIERTIAHLKAHFND